MKSFFFQVFSLIFLKISGKPAAFGPHLTSVAKPISVLFLSLG